MNRSVKRFAVWLSFVDPIRQRNLGACVVETTREDVHEAARSALARGCNPGGDVVGTFVPREKLAADIPEKYWYVLRSAAEWEQIGVSIGREDADARAECPDCKEQLSAWKPSGHTH